MFNRKRFRTLMFFVLAAVGMLVLASGLTRNLIARSAQIRGQETSNLHFGSLLQQLLGVQEWVFYLFFVLYILLIINIFLSKEGRKRFIIFVVIVCVMVWLLLTFGSNQEEPLVLQEEIGTRTTENTLRVTPTPTVPGTIINSEVPHTPEWLVTVVGVILAVVVTGTIAVAVYAYIQRRPSLSITSAISQEAQSALDAIDAGEDYQDVIIRCYAQMSSLLREERGVTRHSAMTPTEFEAQLVRLKFPADPVHSLTHLFEQARYSRSHPGSEGTQKAVDSLSGIVAYCQSLE
jgi:hypothetical protein